MSIVDGYPMRKTSENVAITTIRKPAFVLYGRFDSRDMVVDFILVSVNIVEGAADVF